MTYHALLIGIDAYLFGPLTACVNDIDAVQRLLLDRLGLAPSDITRLDAPRAGDVHDTRVPRADATAANIRAALDRLASAQIQPGDRVFLYYAGHGGSQIVTGGGRTTRREALLAMDSRRPDGSYDLALVLYDEEINRRLAAIAARTSAVSVVLDCCYGAGVTRSETDTRGEIRGVKLPPVTSDHAVPPEPLARGIADCHVVTASLTHETSRAWRIDNRWSGVFTHAFTRAIDDTLRDLRTLTWAEIWQPMAATVAQYNPEQHAWMEGSAGRAVFGGPPADRDPGFAVHYARGAYHVAAGTLASITKDTVLGVYGSSPAYFAGIDSNDDLAARIGSVIVTHAALGTAEAQPIGAAFNLPGDARVRIIKAGERARLRYAIDPLDRAPATMRDALARSGVLEHDDGAEVRLVHHADHWFVTDELHGTGPGGDGRPVLFAIPAAAAPHAVRVLEQYTMYARPVAIARFLAGAGENPTGGLRLEVRRNPATPPRELHRSGLPVADGGLPLVEETHPGVYALTERDAVVFVVDNTTDRTLRVALVNAAASGKVLVLGDQTIQAGEHVVFWHPSGYGQAFGLRAADDRDAWFERVIAIGRTAQSGDLKHLQSPRGLREALDTGALQPVPDPVSRTGAAEHWTATQAILGVRRR